MLRKPYRRFLAACTLIAALAVTGSAHPQTTLPAEPAPVEQEAAGGSNAQAPDNRISAEQALEYERRLTAIETNLQNFRENVFAGVGILAVLTLVFGIGRAIWLHFSEKAERTLHVISLRESAETVRLVNDTLRLAKDANERAAASIERRARIELESIDGAAKDLLSEANRDGVREIVSKPKYRTALEGLAERINAFDIYRIILDESISLTPHCHFLKGLAAHLKNHFEAALEHWRVVGLNEAAEPDLRSQAYYWIGYEYNNLHEFSKAKNNFEEARKHAQAPRSFELERIAIESEFFDSPNGETCMQRMNNLRARAEASPGSEDHDKITDAIRVTAGNIMYAHARSLRASGAEPEALKVFAQARSAFEAVTKPNSYSKLGWAQCCLQLGADAERARELLRTDVLVSAQNEFVSRVERRTKALARFTELMCCLANPSLQKDASALESQILSEIGDVDSRLTLYSLIQRRNVSKAQFQREVATAVKEGTGA